jgi:hypothetical protein
MRVVVDPWDPSYGVGTETDGLAEPTAEVNLALELPPEAWTPRRPAAPAPDVIVFVDGVRRVDARVWVGGEGGAADAGLCASWAAGAVRCAAGVAAVAAVEVGRGLFSASRHAGDLTTGHGVYAARMARASSPEALSLALQERMLATELVAAEAAAAGAPALLVLDGPLRGRQHLSGAVGMIKTHHTAYLTDRAAAVLGALAPGERTPAFTVGTTWTRHSWYVRLPGAVGAPLAGVVRCECSADLDPAAVTVLADTTAAVLPRYASERHKDQRAPQNLYPIGGLERELRRRLGDPGLLYRALCRAAAAPSPSM